MDFEFVAIGLVFDMPAHGLHLSEQNIVENVLGASPATRYCKSNEARYDQFHRLSFLSASQAGPVGCMNSAASRILLSSLLAEADCVPATLKLCG